MSGHSCIGLILKNYKIVVFNVGFIHFDKHIVILIYEKLIRMAIIEVYV